MSHRDGKAITRGPDKNELCTAFFEGTHTYFHLNGVKIVVYVELLENCNDEGPTILNIHGRISGNNKFTAKYDLAHRTGTIFIKGAREAS